MSLPSNVSELSIWRLLPGLVGLILLWTAIIKAIAPYNFRRHLASLGWIPENLLSASVVTAAALEAGWGTALVTRMAPGIVLPSTIVLLAGFSFVSWWGVKSGRTEDCGCYGGFIQPSITQSLGLNFLFIGLILIGWSSQPKILSPSGWQLAAAGIVTVLVGGLAEANRRFEATYGKARFDTNPLKIGKRWRHSWAGGATAQIDGEALVTFLGPDCPYCVRWVQVANAIVQSPTLPGVVGVVATSRDRLESFKVDKGIRFPVALISKSLMSRLTQVVPTTVLIESGRIKDKWVGDMPMDFVDRFKEAFFPTSTRRELASMNTSDGS